MTQKPSAIFLDWDGTLVDSYVFLESAHNHTRKVLGFPPMQAGEFKGYFGQPRMILYEKLYGEKMGDAQKIFEEFYFSHHLGGISVLPGARELLAFIKKSEIVCGVVTNKKASFIRSEIEHLGWVNYFSAVVGAGDANADKPSGAPLQLAIEIAGLDTPLNSVLMVGDTENDLLCAADAGCKSVLIAPQEHHKAILEHCRPDFAFKNCQSFQEFLLQYPQKRIKE